VDGVALMGLDPGDPEVRRLVRSEVACVGIDMEVEGPRAEIVMSDNEAGARQAVEHLIALGHRRIATITGSLESRPGSDRLRGYRASVQAAGLAYRDEFVAYGDWYAESGRECAARLLTLPEPPTAIFAASDTMALGAMLAAAQAGLRVPDDVSIVGFDDIQLAPHLNPPLTTLRQDKLGLGAAAGEGLIARIAGATDRPPLRTLPVELVVRGSTAPPAG
jgi:LacI family transcriptional regulator